MGAAVGEVYDTNLISVWVHESAGTKQYGSNVVAGSSALSSKIVVFKVWDLDHRCTQIYQLIK